MRYYLGLEEQEDNMSTTEDNDVTHVPESPSSVSIVSSENSRSPYTTLATTWTGVSGQCHVPCI